MTGIEKRIRLTTIQEGIADQDLKLIAIKQEDVHGVDRYRLDRASWHLQRAIEMLRGTSFTSNVQDMTTILEASIAGVRGRRACEFIGAEDNNAG